MFKIRSNDHAKKLQEEQEADRRNQESQTAKQLQIEEASRLQIEKLLHEEREADRRHQ